MRSLKPSTLKTAKSVGVKPKPAIFSTLLRASRSRRTPIQLASHAKRLRLFRARRAVAADRRFPIPSVESFDLELREFDSVEASRIDVNLVRVGARNIERCDAAVGAEMMLRDARIEGVGRDVLDRRYQAKALPGHDPVQIPFLRADRAIAFAHALGTARDLESDSSAMASAARSCACRVHRL